MSTYTKVSVVWRVLPVLAVAGAAIVAMPTANADNKRLNDGVVANVYTIQHQHGCSTNIKINPQLRLARPVARPRRAEQPCARR